MDAALMWFVVSSRLGVSRAAPARNYTERQLTEEAVRAAYAAAEAWLAQRPVLLR